MSNNVRPVLAGIVNNWRSRGEKVELQMVVSDSFKSRVFTEVSEDGDTLVIRVSGNFDFNMHRDFQRAYRNASPLPKRFIVDLSTTEHLDSAALGMLLLLRDYCVEAGRDGSDREEPLVELTSANAHVSHILAVSNFDRIFRIR